MVDHDDVIFAGLVFAVGEGASERGLDPEHPEERRRHTRRRDALGLPASSEAHRHATDERHLLERPRVPPPLGEMHRVHRDHWCDVREARHHLVYGVQPRGVAIGERPEQHVIDDAEDRRVGADAQGKRGDGDQREGRALPQRAAAEAQVGT